jgi:hypothetical protein
MAAEKFTAEQVARAVTSAKGLVYLAARALGCSKRTVSRYVSKYDCVKEALEDARGEVVDVAEDKLFKALDAEEPWAIRFVLRSLGQDRGYGYNTIPGVNAPASGARQQQLPPSVVIVARSADAMDLALGRKLLPPAAAEANGQKQKQPVTLEHEPKGSHGRESAEEGPLPDEGEEGAGR